LAADYDCILGCLAECKKSEKVVGIRKATFIQHFEEKQLQETVLVRLLNSRTVIVNLFFFFFGV
jgi:hypothetical protein